MADANSIDVLNRLLAIEYRSLSMYLCDANPWTHPGDERASQTLAHIVADQKALAARIAELIDARGGRVEMGGYSMEFTDTNLLSLDFLVSELLHRQQQDLAAIRACIAELSRDRPARDLAEEVLGAEQAHLEALRELAKIPA